MSLINPIKYLVGDARIPNSTVPVVICPADSVVNGTIICRLPVASITNQSAEVYQISPPTSEDDRYFRISPDLYSTDVLDSMASISSQAVTITYEFDPSALVDATHGNFYSVEFFVNRDSTAAQAAPKVVIVIKDTLK